MSKSKWVRFPNFGLYIMLIDDVIYGSAISRCGFPEQNDNCTSFIFYELNWEYTKRDKGLIDAINAFFKTAFNLKKLTGKHWFNRLGD